MKFEEKIIKLRKEKGWSQEDLAEKLEVSRQAVSRWELGSTLPDIPNLLRLEKIFGVTADYLIHDEVDSVQKQPQTVSESKVSKEIKHRKVVLFIAIFWLVFSVCCLINAILSREAMYVILALYHAVIAVLFFLSYLKNKVKP